MYMDETRFEMECERVVIHFPDVSLLTSLSNLHYNLYLIDAFNFDFSRIVNEFYRHVIKGEELSMSSYSYTS
jgi:hypothetical protein